MAKVPPDIDEKAATKEAGPAGIMALAKKMTKDSPITKLDGKPGATTASTITSGLVITEASVGQVATVLNFVHQLNSRKFTMKVLEGQIKDEKARAKKADAKRAADDSDTRLEGMNKKHFIATDEGKTRVFTEVQDDQLHRMRLEMSTFEDIRNRYSHVSILSGGKFTPLGTLWFNWTPRRQYEGIVFAPGQDVDPKVYNMWRGFAVDPKEGDWSLYRDHLKNIVCAGNEGHYDYLIKMLARGVQFPAKPAEVALVMVGKKGTGKGIMANGYGNLFGRQHFVTVSNPKHITGNFNKHLRDCVVLFCDEAFWAGDKVGQGTLQTLITDEVMAVEPKGVDLAMKPNHLHLIIASEHKWAVPAGEMERRYFVLELPNTRQKDFAYFKAIRDQLKAGGRAAMLHDLLAVDLKGFNIRDVPDTLGLRHQIQETLPTVEKWWLDVLGRGKLLAWHDGWTTEPGKVPFDLLFQDYVKYAGTIGGQRRKSGQTELGMAIQRLTDGQRRRYRNVTYEAWVGTTKEGRAVKETRTGTMLTFPDVDTCRRAFEKVTGTTPEWPEGEDDGPGEPELAV